MSAGLEFAVVGAEHAGTGTLAELLGGHPGLSLSGPDEAPAFTHTHIHRRRPGRGLRRAQAPADAARVRGTVNPAYTRGWHDTTTATVAARIAEAFPDLKLVMLLRDPVERARRQHAAACARGRETRSFDEAARQQLTTDGLSEGRFLPDDTNTYVAQGEYGRILGEYLRHFPRAALCVGETSTLEGDPSGLLRRVLEFLGVSTDHRPEYRPDRTGEP